MPAGTRSAGSYSRNLRRFCDGPGLWHPETDQLSAPFRLSRAPRRAVERSRPFPPGWPVLTAGMRGDFSSRFTPTGPCSAFVSRCSHPVFRPTLQTPHAILAEWPRCQGTRRDSNRHDRFFSWPPSPHRCRAVYRAFAGWQRAGLPALTQAHAPGSLLCPTLPRRWGSSMGMHVVKEPARCRRSSPTALHWSMTPSLPLRPGRLRPRVAGPGWCALVARWDEWYLWVLFFVNTRRYCSM